MTTSRATAPERLPLLDARSAAAMDAAAIAAGTPAAALMARAAGHLARAVIEVGGRAYGLEVAIAVGPGDNGGDGWAAASVLAALGAHVVVVASAEDADRGSAHTRANRAAWTRSGGRVVHDPSRLEGHVVVDALLGTGAHGALRGDVRDAAAALDVARAGGARVVACDVPTGVDADTGAVVDGAVRAEVTVTFGALKRGLLLHPGAGHAGRLVVGGLGAHVAGSVAAIDDPAWWALTPSGARPSPRPSDDEKRRRGTVQVIAGSPGMAGAALLSGRGALVAGAGLVSVATASSVRAEVAAGEAALMVTGLPVDERGGLSIDAVHALADPAETDACVIGPGLGQGQGAAMLTAAVRRRARRLVLDADAIGHHREDPDALVDHDGVLVVTPHARELARLGLGDDAADAWDHRTTRVPALARRVDAIVVAKGPGTLVAAPDGRVWVTPVAAPAAATGGTGDVLAGMLAAALAADAHARPGEGDAALAVARAVWVHAAAAFAAGSGRAQRATVTDLIASVPAVLGRLAAWVPADPPSDLARVAPDWEAFLASLEAMRP